MRKRIPWIVALVAVVAAVVSIVWSVRLYRANRALLRSVPYLTVGEALPYRQLYDTRGQAVDVAALGAKWPVVLLLFEQPCSPCNRNVNLWRKMSGLLAGKAAVCGVVLESLEGLVNVNERSVFGFPLYCPREVESFKAQNRVYMNMAQTVLLVNGKVRFVKMGDIDGGDVTAICRLVGVT